MDDPRENGLWVDNPRNPYANGDRWTSKCQFRKDLLEKELGQRWGMTLEQAKAYIQFLYWFIANKSTSFLLSEGVFKLRSGGQHFKVLNHCWDCQVHTIGQLDLRAFFEEYNEINLSVQRLRWDRLIALENKIKAAIA